MLPNVCRLVFGHMFSLGILWSIGTEEQFYLAWPHVIKKAAANFKILLILLIAIISVKVGCEVIYHSGMFSDAISKIFRFILRILDYDCMVVGAIFAFILFVHKKSILDILYLKSIQVVTLIALFLLFAFNPNLYSLSNLVYGTLYGILILNIASNPNSILSLENKIFNYSGQISYGIYMYHSIFVALGILIVQNTSLQDNPQSMNFFLYPFAVLCTMGAAALSYEFFEKPILHYKEKFMVVKSGTS
jgi:peptidoglycan/LPS O-acetylase OafA/YrhL